ncbi:hypothetical protein BDA96_03G339300 [Sorghum bicolor]|uniref:Uncharacterized protein n=2 Tax=Sorghum bicolor TaxID=4558 RepID=A0A921UPD0_SORBI|nr:hypothetical protein BDA96_03G339300 [Sorghum bicolor]OQU87650.1 hypothetical protein SORBI_3003G314533 [Sorghum bicolor]
MVIVYLNTSHVHFFKIYSLWFPKGCRCRVGSKVAKGSCFTILPLIWAKMPLHACKQALMGMLRLPHMQPLDACCRPPAPFNPLHR